MNFAVPVIALAYSALVLFWLAHALRKLYAPMRAAITAFAISVAVHAVTLLSLDGEYRLVALLFWGVPHALLLPLLLFRAQRAQKG